MPRRMYSINTSFKNYPSFSTPIPSLGLYIQHSVDGEKRGVSIIVADSMYFVRAPQKKYIAEQISTVNIRPAMEVKTFLCIFMFLETTPMTIFVFRSSLCIYSIYGEGLDLVWQIETFFSIIQVAS